MSLSLRLTGLVLIAAITPAIHAAEATDPARKLVDAMQYDKQYELHHENCLSETRKMSLQDFLGGPESPIKIEKNSNQWKSLQAAYNHYIEESCSQPTKNEFLDSLTKAYREKMSAAQIKQATAFYTSKTGQSIAKANQTAAQNITNLYAEAYASQTQIALSTFNQRLQEIIADSKKTDQTNAPAFKVEAKPDTKQKSETIPIK